MEILLAIAIMALGAVVLGAALGFASIKFKVEGNPYVPLDPEAQAFMQSRVDDYYNAFIKAVTKGRGVSVGDREEGA